MKRTLFAVVAGILAGFGTWGAAHTLAGPQTRLAPVPGADYVISIAVTRHPVGQTDARLTLTYTLAKGDGAVAHEATLESLIARDGEAHRPVFIRAASEIADIVLTGRLPVRRQSTDGSGVAR